MQGVRGWGPLPAPAPDVPMQECGGSLFSLSLSAIGVRKTLICGNLCIHAYVCSTKLRPTQSGVMRFQGLVTLALALSLEGDDDLS